MKVLGALIVASPFLCGCAGPQIQQANIADPPPKAPVPLDQLRDLSANEKLQLGKMLAQSLKDPESAHYRWAKIPKVADGTTSYCAYVNAKNSYGGYNGFKMFISVVTFKGGKVTQADIGAIEDSDPRYRTIVPDMCRKEGLYPDINS